MSLDTSLTINISQKDSPIYLPLDPVVLKTFLESLTWFTPARDLTQKAYLDECWSSLIMVKRSQVLTATGGSAK